MKRRRREGEEKGENKREMSPEVRTPSKAGSGIEGTGDKELAAEFRRRMESNRRAAIERARVRHAHVDAQEEKGCEVGGWGAADIGWGTS